MASEKISLVKRKKGTVSGNHYHLGKNKLKNPEILVFLDGKAEFIFKNIKTEEEFKQIFNKPAMFLINSYICHTIKALTDIVFIDMNSVKDGEGDTVKLKD